MLDSIWRECRVSRVPLVVALASPMVLAGCFSSSSSDDDGDGLVSGQFRDIPVEGLTYAAGDVEGTTDADGAYEFIEGEPVTFRVGELALGTTDGREDITVVDLVEGAEGPGDDAVTNIAVLLQTLDHDGDLNSGIRVTDEAAGIVSQYADQVVFDQSPEDFAQSSAVNDLLGELNTAGEVVFDDTDPRDRSLRAADDASATVARALSERRVVTTTHGELRGFTTDDDSAWSWYGVPYAAPPMGELRWRPPQDAEPWGGVRDAIAWGDQSAQDLFYEQFGEGGMSEDSLYLNITAPKDHEAEEPLPVMVWFHGGGFSILTGNTAAFNNTSLPNEGVIVVTVNHRLGPLGYLAHPELTSESEHEASGNYGQLDLVAALEWVQDNIAEFGGDPENVTIFGESGGGGKSLSLLHSPQAEGLFHRAIIQSGMGDPHAEAERFPVERTLADHEAEGERLIEALGLEGDDLLATLREMPWNEIVNTADEIEFDAWPNIDGWYKTMGIQTAFEEGAHNDVPIMSGANSGDYPDLRSGLQWFMPWVAEHNESDVFAYVFSHVPEGWRADDVPAYHGIELVYVFDFPGSFLTHYLLGLTEHDDPEPAKFLSVHDPGVNPAEYSQVSGDVLSAWAAFAETGNPSTQELSWPSYTETDEQYMEIDTTPTVHPNLQEAFD